MISKKAKGIIIEWQEVKRFVIRYDCPSCKTRYIGQNLIDVDRFFCPCGQKLIIKNPRFSKEPTDEG